MPASSIRVVAAVVFRGEQVLACRRAPHKSSGGLWEFPGGKVENGESPEQALRRELEEELSIIATPGRLLHRETTQVGEAAIDLACYLTEISDEPQAGDDHDHIRWVPLDHLLELDWAAPDIPAVKLMTEREQA